jgi:hypothetical protein
MRITFLGLGPSAGGGGASGPTRQRAGSISSDMNLLTSFTQMNSAAHKGVHRIVHSIYASLPSGDGHFFRPATEENLLAQIMLVRVESEGPHPVGLRLADALRSKDPPQNPGNDHEITAGIAGVVRRDIRCWGMVGKEFVALPLHGGGLGPGLQLHEILVHSRIEDDDLSEKRSDRDQGDRENNATGRKSAFPRPPIISPQVNLWELSHFVSSSMN